MLHPNARLTVRARLEMVLAVKTGWTQAEIARQFRVSRATAASAPSPNAGIVAVGVVKERPVARDGEVVIGSMMNATISADHRVGDGAEAAVFLGEFQKNLENPTRLML